MVRTKPPTSSVARPEENIATTRRILILDHNPRNIELLSNFLQKENYHTASVTNLTDLRSIIKNGINSQPILMALLDIAGFDASIWDPVEDLRAKGIPFLIISAGRINNSLIQQEATKRGASGILMKPLVAQELLRFITTITNSTQDAQGGK